MPSEHPALPVLYATARGSTREVADFIATVLAQRGADVADLANNRGFT